MNKPALAIAVSTVIALASGCGTTQLPKSPPPDDIAGELHHISYDSVLVDVNMPYASDQSLDTEGKGAAAKEGFKMMAAAPVGCLQGGLFAGACLAMAPFFPIIAAARAEDPAKARLETETFFASIEEYDLHRKLTERMVGRLVSERLPLADEHAVETGKRPVTINVHVGTLDLDHSGYKNGSIELALPYTVELTNDKGVVISRKSGKVHDDFPNSSRSGVIYPRLNEWVDQIVEESVSGLLLEWQPLKSLGFVYPGKDEKKTLFGKKYRVWSSINTPTPRLEWQPLEAVMPANRMADISDISYEVEIFAWQAIGTTHEWFRHTVAAARDLQEPAFTIENGLRPCQVYHWRPKARFRYRGTVRTTSAPEAFQLIIAGPGCAYPAWAYPVSVSDWSDTYSR
jgi:hypothetical protein